MEFALVIPIFLIVVLALIDIGRGVFIYSALTNAAREGARLAVVNQDQASIAARVQDMAFGVAVETAPSDLVRYYSPQPDLADLETNPACANGTQNPISIGCIAVVRAQGTWQPIALAPVAALFQLATGADAGAPYGAIQLEVRSALPIEFECPNASIPAYTDAAACPKQP